MRPTFQLLLAATAPVAWAQSPEKQRIVDEATATARAAVQLAPTNADAYVQLSSIYVQHKFLRAASGALASAVALSPLDGRLYHELGQLSMRARDVEGASKALATAALLLPHSGQVLVSRAAISEGAEKERLLRTATQLEPRLTRAYIQLARVLQSSPDRASEVESTYRSLHHFDPSVGGKPLFDFLYFAGRKVEAAVAFKRAQRSASQESVAPARRDLDEWTRFVDEFVGREAGTTPAKCLARHCIEGLEEALAHARDKPRADELDAPHDTSSAHAAIVAQRPTVFRRGVEGWGPSRLWDASYLQHVAGEEPLEVTVVTQAGAFEVHSDRIERPPKSTMKLGDFVRMLSVRLDANLTVYSRQASLWPMSALLTDLTPMPWMSSLRVNDLNIWLGDGHFRNTLHFDPYDNFLCQVRGMKHVLLYPPSEKEHLYYARRRDIQASYTPLRGEYGRHDTGIVSANTAAINGAQPDLHTYPLFNEARKAQTYAELRASDCLFLPHGWHHHVFSEADKDSGYNLAINIWVNGDDTVKRRPSQPQERYPLLSELMAALRAVDEADEGSCASTTADGATASTVAGTAD